MPQPLSVAFDHVQIAAPRGCEDDARRFYGELVGLEELPKPDALVGNGGCWFAVGAQELHVGVEDDFTPARKAHAAIRLGSTEQLDALAGRLEAAAVAIRWDDRLPDARRFYAADPWGNRLEFLARD